MVGVQAVTDSQVPNFDANDHALVAQLLLDRYGHAVDLQDADAELRLDPESSTLTS